jgi:hypothetical protein
MPEITDKNMPPPASTTTGQRPPAEEQGKAGAVASRAGDEAVALKDESIAKAADVKDKAVAEAANVADSAREEAVYVLGEVREQLSGQVDDAAHRLAAAVKAAADELRSMAERSDEPRGTMTNLVRQIADRSSEMGNRLETDGYRGVVDDLARLGRNRPGVFLLAAGAAGFAAGRLLRNTDSQAIVKAAKGESSGSNGDGQDQRPPVTTGTSASRPTAVMPGSAERLAGAATVAEPYAPPLGASPGVR